MSTMSKMALSSCLYTRVSRGSPCRPSLFLHETLSTTVIDYRYRGSTATYQRPCDGQRTRTAKTAVEAHKGMSIAIRGEGSGEGAGQRGACIVAKARDSDLRWNILARLDRGEACLVDLAVVEASLGAQDLCFRALVVAALSPPLACESRVPAVNCGRCTAAVTRCAPSAYEIMRPPLYRHLARGSGPAHPTLKRASPMTKAGQTYNGIK